MTNRLAAEKSLYLREHAENPVNWWPWCAEAFEEAKAKKLPIIVSIGYSSCHWCHVMARKSFNDAYIAGLMNEHFVCIKVDREERPDVDNLYMEVLQMLEQRGGWPLNVFCLPDGRPFFGGTYFPPEDNGYGMIPWPQLLMRIANHYKLKPEELIENADNIQHNLGLLNNPNKNETAFSNSTIIGAAQVLTASVDPQHGGFMGSPKFPLAMCLDYMITVRNTKSCETSHAPLDSQLDTASELCLTGMARGGLYDHIGGGFMRYCVDEAWKTPHFEKMLYDNALLIQSYTRGYLQYRKEEYKTVIEETIAWILRDMKTDFGAYAASFSAESEGVEGVYYLWLMDEIKAVLPEDKLQAFCEQYQLTPEGNFANGLSLPRLLMDADSATWQQFKAERIALFQSRETRVKPARDSKQLLYWNALLVSALAEAGYYLERSDWLTEAVRLADCLWATFMQANGELLSVCYENEATVKGFLHDYASLAEAYLSLAGKVDLIQPGLSVTYIKRAEQLANKVLELFNDNIQVNNDSSDEADPVPFGFYFTADEKDSTVFFRKKEFWDNALPAGNSSILHVFSQLHAITGDSKYSAEYSKLKEAYANLIVTAPSSVAHAIHGIVSHEVGVAVLYVHPDADFQAIQKKLAKRKPRKCFVMVSDKLNDKQSFQFIVKGKIMEGYDSIDAVLEKI